MRRAWQSRIVGRAAIVVLLLALSARSAVAQSDWDRYKPGTLAAVIAEINATIRESLIDKRPSDHFVGSEYSILATVIYKGESRPIDRNRRQLIARWGLSYKRDSSLVADFQREYLFQEGTKLFWLPVQDTVASFFPKELRPGDRVRVFVMLLGGHFENDKITWAFIVNEFAALPAPRS